MKTKRIEWIDTIKWICIICVMMSHLGGSKLAPGIRIFYGNFFLTGFLFASGYTYRHRVGFGKHLFKKAKQLLVPWFFFSVGQILLTQVVTLNPEKHQSLASEMMWNFLQIRKMKDGVWFVAALFVAYVFFYWMIDFYERERITKNPLKKYLLISVLFFVAYYAYIDLMPGSIFPWGTNPIPWHIEYIPYALAFMFLGYAVKTKLEPSLDSINKNKLTMIVILVINLVFVYTYKAPENAFFWIFDALGELISALTALLALCLICKRIKSNKYIAFVGQNTLIYFGLHGKLMSVFEKVFHKVLPSVYDYIYTTEIPASVYSVLVALLFSVLLIIPAMIINRYFPFVMGKWYKKKR